MKNYIKKLAIIGWVAISASAQAQTVTVAVFTGLEICNPAPLPSGIQCATYLDFKEIPNVDFQMVIRSNGSFFASAKRDDSQLDLPITTDVVLSKASSTAPYHLEASSLMGTETTLVNTVKVDFDKIENLKGRDTYGKAFHVPNQPSITIRPFIHIGQPFIEMPPPQHL